MSPVKVIPKHILELAAWRIKLAVFRYKLYRDGYGKWGRRDDDTD